MVYCEERVSLRWMWWVPYWCVCFADLSARLLSYSREPMVENLEGWS